MNAANRAMSRCTGAAGGAAGASGISFACGSAGPGGGGPGGGGPGGGTSANGGAPGVLPSTAASTTSTSSGAPAGTTSPPAGGPTTTAPSAAGVTSTAASGSTTTSTPTRGVPSTTVGPTSTQPPVTTLPPLALRPLAQPTARHPITIVQIGDSLGEDLGFGLQDVIGAQPSVKLETVAVGDTGLADPAYYDWPKALQRDLAKYHPAIVIAMFGGNDCQSFFQGPTLETPGTASFDTAYSSRVGGVMEEAIEAGARVLWVGMPIMHDPGFSSCMAELNRDDAAEAASHPGATFLSTWKLFEGPNGQYSEYLDVDGNLVEVRDGDGVHIDGPAGTDLVGGAVLTALEADYHIKL